MSKRLDLISAYELLDFRNGAAKDVISEAVAEEQLKGAVALHNLLQDQGVAYLADEVGMGKTYVALGAMALFRHFQPDFRVLVLAPKENIQKKWMKEWRNFVARVVRIEDLRVKGLGGHPARALVKVDTLVDLVTESSNDPDRDFFARLTSFSLPIFASDGNLSSRRDQLLKAVPWLDSDLLNAKNKEQYKRNFARAVNCALPNFDLLIVDEAHNLKAGWKDGKSAIRNTVVGCALGGRLVNDEFTAAFRGYRGRAKRVLFLSATPIEYDIRQLWNQLDLLGFGSAWLGLRDHTRTNEEHRAELRKLLIRRTAKLWAGGVSLTKTEYRREWRAGGVTTYDEPLQITGDQPRLAVALIQKKVSELIGSGKHNHSFQVGLLASFESFLETVKSRTMRNTEKQENSEDEEVDESSFHRSAEEIAATKERRQDGLDIDAINKITRDHLLTLHHEMPHPKMDAMVDELARSFSTGRKALVFVRRVASVDELQRKLEEKYDELLIKRLRRELRSDALRAEINQQKTAYNNVRAESRHRIRARDIAFEAKSTDAETSSVDSFFAWFFRGEGPTGVRSGASIARQMDSASGNYSTLLEDNYVAALLSVPVEDVVSRLAQLLGVDKTVALERVARKSAQYLGPERKRIKRREQMQAFQAAALDLLVDIGGRIGEEAGVVLREVFAYLRPDSRQERMVPDGESWLSTRTLFTELRLRTDLCEKLWPQPTEGDSAKRLRERELRRELLATMVRKGHPIIDLFILIANRLGTLKQRSREAGEDQLPDLAVEFLDLLIRQRHEEVGTFNSYYELSEASANFNLIGQLNMPELQQTERQSVSKVLGRFLRAQRPVAGMAGKINGELVKQFRMPGYPLILITTDLLKEGEDLHTFCSSVHHYGIAWMPSELEQRVGRIDRVGSQTERRLAALGRPAVGEDKLQVYYPHLGDTVEVLQLNRVYARLNRFLRVMHEGLGTPPREMPQVNVASESLRVHQDTAAISERLRSAFEVTPDMWRGQKRSLTTTRREAEQIKARLTAIECLLRDDGARAVQRMDGHQIVGEMVLEERVQPFTLLLRSLRGRPVLRCVSPIGRIGEADWQDERAASILLEPFTRITLERNERFEAYDVSVEGDIVLGASLHDRARMCAMFHAVITAADRIEKELLHVDATLGEVRREIDAEVNVDR